MKVKLYAPDKYITMSKEEPEELMLIVNGCGAANAKFDFVPDKIYGLKITEACNIHDFMYMAGETIEDKEEADRVFLNNVMRIIDKKGGKLKILRKIRAKAYYQAVKHFGAGAYWSGKNPENMIEVNI